MQKKRWPSPIAQSSLSPETQLSFNILVKRVINFAHQPVAAAGHPSREAVVAASIALELYTPHGDMCSQFEKGELKVIRDVLFSKCIMLACDVWSPLVVPSITTVFTDGNATSLRYNPLANMLGTIAVRDLTMFEKMLVLLPVMYVYNFDGAILETELSSRLSLRSANTPPTVANITNSIRHDPIKVGCYITDMCAMIANQPNPTVNQLAINLKAILTHAFVLHTTSESIFE